MGRPSAYRRESLAGTSASFARNRSAWRQHRGLACTGRPHQHHPLTGGDRERHTGQHAPSVAIVERDVVEDDLALELRRFDRIGRVPDAGFDVRRSPRSGRCSPQPSKTSWPISPGFGSACTCWSRTKRRQQLARHQGPVQYLERAEEDGGTGRDGTEDLHAPGGGGFDARRQDSLPRV